MGAICQPVWLIVTRSIGMAKAAASWIDAGLRRETSRRPSRGREPPGVDAATVGAALAPPVLADYKLLICNGFMVRG